MGWKVSTSATASFVLDALEQVIHARRPGPEDGLIHHSDRGTQYFAMNYTQRLAEANLVSSVGSIGDGVACPQTRPEGQTPWPKRSTASTRSSHLEAAVVTERIGSRNGDPALGRRVQ